MIRKLFVLLAIVFVLAPAAIAQTWTAFDWGAVHRFGRDVPKGLVFLPVELEGLPGKYRMVLDTTQPGTVLYGKTVRAIAAEVREPRLPAQSQSGRTRLKAALTVGAARFADALMHIDENGEGPQVPMDQTPVIGAVGLDLLQTRTWIVDFPRKQFAVLDSGAALPKPYVNRMDYFGATQRNNRLFVTVATTEPIGDFLFDTTSGLFPLLTTKPSWQRMTGRWGDEKNNAKVGEKGDGWETLFVGFRTPATIRLGGRPVARVNVFTMIAGPDEYKIEGWPFPAAGVIGTQPFQGSTMVFELAQNRIGLVGQARKG